jgi:hypothetical protein
MATILMAGILIFCFKGSPELLIIAVPILIALDYVIFYLPSRVEFDEESIFIRKGRDPEFLVPLRNVRLIKSLWLNIGFHNLCKITYVLNGKQMRVYVYPRAFSSTNADFVKQLKSKNPGVEIKGF